MERYGFYCTGRTEVGHRLTEAVVMATRAEAAVMVTRAACGVMCTCLYLWVLQISCADYGRIHDGGGSGCMSQYTRIYKEKIESCCRHYSVEC